MEAAGWDAIAVQLVARVENISLDSKETKRKEFPKLFSGLGKMEGEDNIVLKHGASFAETTPENTAPNALSTPDTPGVQLDGRQQMFSHQDQGTPSVPVRLSSWC